MYAFVSIGIGAAVGAWLRWWLGIVLNNIFPTMPLGTLAANLIGGFLIGIFMAYTRHYTLVPEAVRMLITTGFLSGLTTFSTFSAEAVTLIMQQQYVWTALIMCSHVAGSILATICGIYFTRLLIL